MGESKCEPRFFPLYTPHNWVLEASTTQRSYSQTIRCSFIHWFTWPFTAEGSGNKQLVPRRRAHDFTVTVQPQARSLEDSNFMPIIRLYYTLAENYMIKLTNPLQFLSWQHWIKWKGLRLFLIEMDLV